MNTATSQEVFAGPYLTDEKERAKFSAAFIAMTRVFPLTALQRLWQQMSPQMTAFGRQDECSWSDT